MEQWVHGGFLFELGGWDWVSGCLKLAQQVIKQRISGIFGVFSAHGEIEVVALVGKAAADVGGQGEQLGVGFGDWAHGGGDGG